MEAIVFIGLQASGKTSFYKERFFSTHVRVSLDLIRTRHREERLLDLCLETQQKFAVDNTNPTRAERARYITRAREAEFKVTGFYFQSHVEACFLRNAARDVSVPEVGILATAKKLERPVFDEGFDEIWYVSIGCNGFVLEEWNREI